jgi:hypothetical protein
MFAFTPMLQTQTGNHPAEAGPWRIFLGLGQQN